MNAPKWLFPYLFKTITSAVLGGLGIFSAFSARAGVVLTTLHSFGVPPDGSSPYAGLIQGRDGNFYGTTSSGGAYEDQFGNGQGTVFRIDTNGVIDILHSFTGDDGRNPQSELVQDGEGNFYGTTPYGNMPTDTGSVFRIDTNQTFTVLYSFAEGGGGQPLAGLVQGRDGSFYGTTQMGPGEEGFGTVFKITPNGALTTLYVFPGGGDLPLPNGGIPNELVQASDGNFYGTTQRGGLDGNTQNGLSGWGTVFKITTNGELTTLYSFTGGDDGAYPACGLVQGKDGNLYGSTVEGGPYGGEGTTYGTVFKISTNGIFTSLYSFTGGNDGAFPRSALIQSDDGYFYSTTFTGGAFEFAEGAGTLFRISANGTLRTLYSFTGGSDGRYPQGALIEGGDGNFYGTTSDGAAGGGTVFRMAITGPAAPAFQSATLNGRTLSLTWSAEDGESYQLQYTFDLNSSNWTNLGNPVTANGTILNATDGMSGPQRLYRVVLLP